MTTRLKPAALSPVKDSISFRAGPYIAPTSGARSMNSCDARMARRPTRLVQSSPSRYAASARALRRWEPRLRLGRVQVADAAPGHVVLDLEGEYLPTGETVRLEGIEV